ALGLDQRFRKPVPETATAVNPPHLMAGNFELVQTTPSRLPPIGSRPALNGPSSPEDLIADDACRGLNQPAITKPAAAGAYTPPPAPVGGGFVLPPLELLEPSPPFPIHEHEAKISARAMLLERTLLDFGYQVRVVQIDTGPVITQFEIELEAGLRVSRIIGLADDLAIALAGASWGVVDGAGGAERADCGADSGEDDRWHRGPQRPPGHGQTRRGDFDRQCAARRAQDPPLPRQGRERNPARFRPRRHATPVDRRQDW